MMLNSEWSWIKINSTPIYAGATHAAQKTHLNSAI